MYQVKLTTFGTSHAMVIPASMLRALGWLKGDRLMVFVKGEDIVVRNDSQRAARFTKDFRARPQHQIAAENR